MGGGLNMSILENIGCYVPYKNRTEENNWYGKDMALSDEQAQELKEFVDLSDTYYKDKNYFLVLRTIGQKYRIGINADW